MYFIENNNHLEPLEVPHQPASRRCGHPDSDASSSVDTFLRCIFALTSTDTNYIFYVCTYQRWIIIPSNAGKYLWKSSSVVSAWKSWSLYQEDNSETNVPSLWSLALSNDTVLLTRESRWEWIARVGRKISVLKQRWVAAPPVADSPEGLVWSRQYINSSVNQANKKLLFSSLIDSKTISLQTKHFCYGQSFHT